MRLRSMSNLVWAPRILAIAYILFLSLFALDAFAGDTSFLSKLGGFLIHLIPSFVLVVLLAVSWTRPAVGAIAFLLVASVFTVLFETYKELINFTGISLPLILVGGLFALTYAVSRNAKSL